MNAAEIKEKYGFNTVQNDSEDIRLFMYENGGKQCRVHTSSGPKGDSYVVYAVNEFFGDKGSDIAFKKLKTAVEKFAKGNGYEAPTMHNAYDMTFVLKRNAKTNNELATLRDNAQKSINAFLSYGRKASRAVAALNKALVKAGISKGMVDWHDVCEEAKLDGNFVVPKG